VECVGGNVRAGSTYDAQAQRTVIVVASPPEQVGVISGSGIATGGWIGSLADAARWSPAAAVDGGRTWMVVHRGQPATAIAS
jgi:hypothetical protein